MMGSTMATATACLLQGALRALRRTSEAPSSITSTIIASNLWRASLRSAASASLHKSTEISRSPNTRRNTRTIFSSEQSSNDFRLMSRPVFGGSKLRGCRTVPRPEGCRGGPETDRRLPACTVCPCSIGDQWLSAVTSYRRNLGYFLDRGFAGNRESGRPLGVLESINKRIICLHLEHIF